MRKRVRCSEVAQQRRLGAMLRDAGQAVVAVPLADLLQRPAGRAPLADQALLGEVLLVLRDPGPPEFVRVQTAAGYHGWVHTTALSRRSAGLAAEASLEVTALLALVYAEPDVTLRRPLLAAPLGARLVPDGEGDQTWLALRLPDGRRAFVHRGDVVPVGAVQPSAARVVERALRYEGAPYLWGGRSPLGIDCSGLVSNAYAACGLLPPRDAAQQYEWGALTPAWPAGPGDLLFFKEKQHVNHVGISLGGDEFVHATTAERPSVHRSRLTQGRWQASLIGVRRHPKLSG